MRKASTRQITVKLCSEKNGCRVHYDFHMGCPIAANRIRKALAEWEIQWMVQETNSQWVRDNYPHKLTIPPEGDIIQA